jgi:hypothetical protein
MVWKTGNIFPSPFKELLIWTIQPMLPVTTASPPLSRMLCAFSFPSWAAISGCSRL